MRKSLVERVMLRPSMMRQSLVQKLVLRPSMLKQRGLVERVMLRPSMMKPGLLEKLVLKHCYFSWGTVMSLRTPGSPRRTWRSVGIKYFSTIGEHKLRVASLIFNIWAFIRSLGLGPTN